MTAATAVCYPLVDLGATILRYAARTIPCMFVRTRIQHPFRSPLTPGRVQPASSTSRPTASLVMAALLGCAAVGVLLHPDVVHAKRKPVQADPPDLRIVAVTLAPEPYFPGEGPLDFTVEVELPHDLNDATMLEVSSLISSPSKSSLRFLASRQSVAVPHPADSAPQAQPSVTGALGNAGESAPHGSAADVRDDGVRGSEGERRMSRIAVTLTWDGRDQTKQVVINGRYGYEVRAKLLVVGENGPRTLMVSWPKHGTLEVK